MVIGVLAVVTTMGWGILVIWVAFEEFEVFEAFESFKAHSGKHRRDYNVAFSFLSCFCTCWFHSRKNEQDHPRPYTGHIRVELSD